MSVTIKIRSRLSSVGDSAPPSESSDGSTSETFEHGSDWHQTEQPQHMANESIYSGSSDMHMMSPDMGGAISDNERVQVESFFSGLGTEVSRAYSRPRSTAQLNCKSLKPKPLRNELETI